MSGPAADEARVVDNREALRYEIWVGSELAGFCTYQLRPGRLVFVHTETVPGFEGRGYATRLVQGALEDLRDRNLRVLPLCPFVAAYIDKHPEYASLRAEPDLG